MDGIGLLCWIGVDTNQSLSSVRWDVFLVGSVRMDGEIVRLRLVDGDGSFRSMTDVEVELGPGSWNNRLDEHTESEEHQHECIEVLSKKEYRRSSHQRITTLTSLTFIFTIQWRQWIFIYTVVHTVMYSTVGSLRVLRSIWDCSYSDSSSFHIIHPLFGQTYFDMVERS